MSATQELKGGVNALRHAFCGTCRKTRGFGMWDFLTEDPSLGLADKVFLEEGKAAPQYTVNESGEKIFKPKPIPSAIHLVRRGDALLRAIREHELEDKSASAQHSSSKKSVRKRSPGNHVLKMARYSLRPARAEDLDSSC